MQDARQWLQRNLGLTDAGIGGPRSAIGSQSQRDQDWRREIIDYDLQGPAGASFAARAPLATIGLSHFVSIPWPTGLAPIPGPRPSGESLPHADVLIVTWTMDEGHALSRVLTPGFDSRDDWKPYTKNFAAIAAQMRPGCPARELGRLGTYWTCRIGNRDVTLFKSDSHMSQDGPDLPNATVWHQIIADSKPKWVITTGTGGGIGTEAEVGDVVVSRFLTFDCTKEFKKLNGQSFFSKAAAPATHFTAANHLFSANSALLPKDNTRPPRIVTAHSEVAGILTTDFFGFDDTANTYQLQGKGALSEMGDAVLGLVCSQLGAAAPSYVGVRNVSDPQINSGGLTIQQQERVAADIYQAYGLWSTVCSAIVCWAIAAAV